MDVRQAVTGKCTLPKRKSRGGQLFKDSSIRHHQLERWREVTRPFFEIKPLTATAAFAGRVSFAQAGSLVLSKVTFSSQRMEHDPLCLKGFDHEYLLFERYHAGCGRGLVDGEVTRIDASTMHLVDMSRHYLTLTSPVAAEGVLIPHAAVGYDPSRHQAYVSVEVASSRGRVLAAALQAMRDAADRSSPEDGSDLAAAFSGLVRTQLLGERDAADGERARARVLHAYILRHLDEPDLTVERLCRDLCMSRATLYRLLDEEGGARRYITALRLDRCFAELVRSTAQRGQVRRVAERWSFDDAASFHRRFRQRFGFAPSDCMGQVDRACSVEPTPVPRAAVRTILDWMRLRGTGRSGSHTNGTPPMKIETPRQ